MSDKQVEILEGKENIKARWESLRHDTNTIAQSLQKPKGMFTHKDLHEYNIRFKEYMDRLKRLNKDTKELLRKMEEENK